MRDAQVAVREAAAHGHDLHVGAVVADVVADLLETAQGREVADGVGEHDLAGKGHAGGQADHVLLRDAGVDELVGVLALELLDDGVAEVADHEAHASVLARELIERLDERGPHEASTSASAVTSSSGDGAL